MKKYCLIGFMALVMFSTYTQAADANAAQTLAKKNGCFACHGVDKKLVGPAYQDVAKKYKDDKGAEAKLIGQVKKGSSGNWGPMPMPPNAHVKDEDIKTIVQWILSLS